MFPPMPDAVNGGSEPTSSEDSSLLFRIPLWMDLSMHLLPAVALILRESLTPSSPSAITDLSKSQQVISDPALIPEYSSFPFSSYPPLCLCRALLPAPTRIISPPHCIQIPTSPLLHCRDLCIHRLNSRLLHSRAPIYPSRINNRSCLPRRRIRSSLQYMGRALCRNEWEIPIPFPQYHG